MEKPDVEPTIHRVGKGKYLHRLIPIVDRSGKVIHSVLKPLMVELRARDVFQIIVGSSILAIPVGFTEETWNLGLRLPLPNVILLGLISIGFIAVFVYSTFYKEYFRDYFSEFVKRVAAIYVLSLVVVALLLTIIQQCPWSTDWVLALKRVIIVSFPASMSAAVTDAIK